MSDTFSEALALHRAGRLEEAAHMYNRILGADPNQIDCLHLLGVIAHQVGNNEKAVEWIQQALGARPESASYYVNLSAALRGLGRHGEAANACVAALNLQPDSIEARLGLGLSLQAMKQYAEAETHFRAVMEQWPEDSRGPQSLGSCLREHGRTEEAIPVYHEALKRNSNDGAAHLGLGTLLLLDKQPASAEPHLRRATELFPKLATAWQNFGTCLLRLNRDREAVNALQTGLEMAPNDLQLAVNLGQAWLSCGNSRSAENCFKAVLNVNPDFPPALSGMGEVLRALDRPEEAVRHFERALQLDPNSDAYKGLADALWESDELDRAVAVLRQHIVRYPEDAENHVRLAVMLASGGDLDGAVESCRAALRIRPGYPLALVELAQILRAKLPAADRQQLENAFQLPLPEPARAGLHFGLAQVADAQGEFGKAAEHVRQANELNAAFHRARDRGYDPDKFDRDIDKLIAVFGPEFFARTKGFGVSDDRPVFIVGMPRSGTTLVEQILACHSKVFGAGERRFAYQSLVLLAQQRGHAAEPLRSMEGLTPEMVRAAAEWHLEQLRQLDGGRSARAVDKMPENYMMLGWLAVQFPNAKVIHCRRDVRDVALSCWMTSFARARWADDLTHIANRVRAYETVMRHWRKVLPMPIFELDYERLVVDLADECQKLVAWLGLEWEPGCLDFHRSERLVKTASVTQVRQPIYTRSVGRWKNYRAALEPFLAARPLES